MSVRRGPYRKSRAQRRRILETAGGTMRLTGVDAISLHAVAVEVGLSSAGVLHHFASKDALIAHLLADLSRDLRDRGLTASCLAKDPQEWVSLFESIRATSPGLSRSSALLFLGPHASQNEITAAPRACRIYWRMRTRFTADLGLQIGQSNADRVLALIDGVCLRADNGSDAASILRDAFTSCSAR